MDTSIDFDKKRKKDVGKAIAVELLRNKYILFPLEMPGEVKDAKCYVQDHGTERDWQLINIPCFRRIIMSTKIRAILEEVYDKYYHLTSYSSNTVFKGTRSVWHTDHPYYKGNSPDKLKSNTSPLSIQVNIALDDFTEENGATQYRVGDKVSQFICPAGTVMMYLGNLWHCAGENRTNEPRSVLLSNFCPLHVDGFIVKGAPQIREQITNDDPDFVVVDKKVYTRITPYHHESA